MISLVITQIRVCVRDTDNNVLHVISQKTDNANYLIENEERACQVNENDECAHTF